MASTDELWLVDFGNPYRGEPASYRPALVIGPSPALGTGFPFVIVVPLTTTYRRLSIHVEVGPASGTGLDLTSFIQCELIRSVNRSRLIHRLGSVAPDISHQVRRIIRTLLDY